MTKEKEIEYRKAYVELYEVFKVLNSQQMEKIPRDIINYVTNNMDTNYTFKYDLSKSLNEQNFMDETKALILEIYERYLAPSEEDELWKKYDSICANIIEEKKVEKYDYKHIFNNEAPDNTSENIENTSADLPIVYEKESLFKRIIIKIKKIFRKD